MKLTIEDFKKRIEFSLCQQFADQEDVIEFCEKALAAEVGVACVNPVHVAQTVALLKGSGIEISGNVGFPFGSHPAAVKALEAEFCVGAGATQIDMVMDIGALKSGQDEVVLDEIGAVVEKADGRPVKVIIEAWVLTEEEKLRGSRLVEQGGAQLVKTSTGVRTQYLGMVNDDPKGATIEDVKLIRSAVSEKMRVKASGGIYSLEDAVNFLRVGTDQLGVSKGAELIAAFAAKYPDGIEL